MSLEDKRTNLSPPPILFMSLEDKRTNLSPPPILFMSLEDKRDNLCMRFICASKMRLILFMSYDVILEIIYACAALAPQKTG